MAAIHDLLEQIADPRLRERIAREWEAATKYKKFGLVYERHLPELIPLWKARPRRGDLVAIRTGPINEIWRVRRIEHETAVLVRTDTLTGQKSTGDRMQKPAADLLVVKQFGDAIFPTLIPVEAVHKGDDNAPWHTLIEA